MKYRQNRNGEPLSVLGFGCMRFTRHNGRIDLDKAEQEILAAYRAGVNYYDTAYVYSGSEETLGTILARNGIREQVNIATKLPQYLLTSRAAAERFFAEELKRLRTDHVDYYLLHMLTDIAVLERLERMGILDWMQEKKKEGKIRYFGFSYHGDSAMFLKILNAYDWDFCQIQYNYMDEQTQAGRTGLQAAAARGIPVIIMEPLRGGKLVNLLPEKARQLLAADPRHRTAAELGLQWLYDQPEVTVVLSGMNSLAMVEENCRIASQSEAHMLKDEDFVLYEQMRQAIQAAVKVGCTECRYCMPCPHGVSIPETFRAYNRMYTENKAAGRKDYVVTVALQKDAGLVSRCVNCGACLKKCPQQLAIPDLLKQAYGELMPLPYRLGVAAARGWLNRK